MLLKFTAHSSHVIRNRSAQCLSLLAHSNPDQCYVWATTLFKEIGAHLGAIDPGDPNTVCFLTLSLFFC